MSTTTGFLSGLRNRVSNATATTLGQFNNSNIVRGSKAFLSTNSLVAKIVFLILVVIMFILLMRWGAYLLTRFMAPNQNPKLISGMKQGETGITISQNPGIIGSIPVMRSRNQTDGLEFTYTVWIRIRNLPSSGNVRKHIFHKGSEPPAKANGIFYPNNAPGLYIHPTRNTLIVVMNTFKNITEEVEINDIPLNKWVNVAIRVEGNKMDVYINGTIALRHIFSSVPKQNYGNVYVNMNHGFNGLLSDLWYHDYALSASEIESIVKDGPDMRMNKSLTSGLPNYLSLNWFFQNSEAPANDPTWPTQINN